MFEKYKFEKICKNIRDVKIQGATDIAKAALKAYFLFPTEKTKKKLLSLRPTEPMLAHVLALADKKPKKEILSHFTEAQEKINKHAFMLIKNNSKIFTHCHSTNVINALIYAKRHGRHFEVYNTETRPLYQGRKTAKELADAGIKVTNFIDAAAEIAIAKQGRADKEYVNLILLGADALLEDAVINKVGSGMISRIAYDSHIPVYIVADSWKYAHKSMKLEQRNFKEVWGTKKVHVRNPAFEAIPSKFITGIISEYGLLEYKNFIKKVKNKK